VDSIASTCCDGRRLEIPIKNSPPPNDSDHGLREIQTNRDDDQLQPRAVREGLSSLARSGRVWDVLGPAIAEAMRREPQLGGPASGSSWLSSDLLHNMREVHCIPCLFRPYSTAS